MAAADAEPAPANAFETRIVIEELLEAGDLEAALALADRLLELAEAEFGGGSAQVAEAHLLIARAHNANGDYTAAETSILSAIEVYESLEGPVSARLIDPFLDLGDNYEEAGDYQGAISAYSEARTIGRRNYGLLNERQLEIIDDMTAAAVRLGEFEEARNLQLEALTLVERNFNESSVEAIEARFKFATWLREHRRYEEERRLYFEIQRIAAREHSDNPLLTVRALMERAASYRDEDNGDGLGISGLRDALEMLQAMSEPPPLLLAEVHVAMADWNVEFDRAGVTGNDYIEAWRLLGRVENGEEIRREWFSELTVVEMDPVSRRDLSADPSAPEGFVEIHFTVDVTGRTRDLEITGSHPPGLKDAAFMRQYREARFRPRVENGELVAARRARRNEFRYDPEAVEGAQ
ncbi:MAG TPA: tetratricopeptide repeat protein [Gammaproteobacteria bacterium]|nr:tetratricopeptide repeat protein [Gammaproteobacteria bacterium]